MGTHGKSSGQHSPIDDRTQTVRGVRIEYDYTDVHEELERLVGRPVNPQELLALTGARPGDHLRIHELDTNDFYIPQGIIIKRWNPSGDLRTNLTIGRPSRHARDFAEVAGATPPQPAELAAHVNYVGSETKSVQSARQIMAGLDAMKRLGIHTVFAEAAGMGPDSPYAMRDSAGRSFSMYNGYYTWALLGANGVILEEDTARSARRYFHDPALNKVQDVMDKPAPGPGLMKGPAWWKRYGSEFMAVLDLHPTGRTNRAAARFRTLLERER